MTFMRLFSNFDVMLGDSLLSAHLMIFLSLLLFVSHYCFFDVRHYLLDLMRVTPRDANYTGAGSRFCILRPELIRAFCQVSYNISFISRLQWLVCSTLSDGIFCY